jgi:hypothetical protein
MKKRGSRRTPVSTPHKSTVVYPSTLFSLQKDEIFPYERYAYNVLAIGVEALNVRGFSEKLTVDFTRLQMNSSPWTINASVEAHNATDGSATEFVFVIPELAPAILYIFSAVVGYEFCTDEGFEKIQKNPDVISDLLHLFVRGAGVGVTVYKDKGVGFAIRAAYDNLGLTIRRLYEVSDIYNALTEQIAYHEVAHAYIGQFTRSFSPSPAERKASELIADLVATEWFYRKMIGNTPDTEEYRALRSMGSYRETLLANSLMSLRYQQFLIMVFAVAGAQRHGGKVTLRGGTSHPPGMQRFMLQHMHLSTLIRSNLSPPLLASDFDRINREWEVRMDALIRSGLIPVADLKASFDVSECDTIELAARLIEEQRVSELKKVIPFLNSIRGSLDGTGEMNPSQKV